jgi:hypothetical protein
MLTLAELKGLLASQVDEVDLLELLNITSEDLVERFEDLIEARFEFLSQEFEEGEGDD